MKRKTSPPGRSTRRLISNPSDPGETRRRPPLSFRAAAALSAAGGALLLLGLAVVLLIYWQGSQSPGESAAPPTVTATEAPTEQPIQVVHTVPLAEVLRLGEVTYDATHQYAFPIAADPSLYFWTHYHWDQTNPIDFKARFGLTFQEYSLVTTAPIIAVTAGTLVVYSGPTGGSGYTLIGDDGVDYYYAHLSEQWVEDGARVVAGQPIGKMGNTGKNAQFIERHLHMAISPRGTLRTGLAQINAAELVLQRFGLPWQDRPPHDIPYSTPQGWPVHHPALQILTPYAASHTLTQPSIELGFTQAMPDASLDVIATLDGEIVINRWTALYGTRIQITNPASQTTVVASNVDEWFVEDGDVVTAGQIVGRWNPARHPRLNYIIFRNGVTIDPATTLGPPGE